MMKFEYYIYFSCADGRRRLAEIDALGDEGWELVAVTKDTNYCNEYTFKRPLQDS